MDSPYKSQQYMGCFKSYFLKTVADKMTGALFILVKEQSTLWGVNLGCRLPLSPPTRNVRSAGLQTTVNDLLPCGRFSTVVHLKATQERNFRRAVRIKRLSMVYQEKLLALYFGLKVFFRGVIILFCFTLLPKHHCESNGLYQT